MFYGISVYSSADFTLEKNKEYIKMAKENGATAVFTSMHMPEVNYDEKLKEIKEIFQFVKETGLKLTSDVSPVTFKTLGASIQDIAAFKEIGLDCLRLDYGFSPKDIADLTGNKFNIGIELNASTITKKLIEDIMKAGANRKNLRTCHNFYPRPFTGLSYEFFLEKSNMIKEYGLDVAAFIPSQSGKRGPIYEGLPTIEAHRHVRPELAARYMAYTNLVDGFYFGDAYASEEELKGSSTIDDNVIELNIKLINDVSEYEKAIIFSKVHTNRPDASEYIIRSEESRTFVEYRDKLTPRESGDRKRYAITIDNSKFLRYAGELQICLGDLPRDERVNVVGFVAEEERILLQFIKPGSKFRLKEG